MNAQKFDFGKLNKKWGIDGWVLGIGIGSQGVTPSPLRRHPCLAGGFSRICKDTVAECQHKVSGHENFQWVFSLVEIVVTRSQFQFHGGLAWKFQLSSENFGMKEDRSGSWQLLMRGMKSEKVYEK